MFSFFYLQLVIEDPYLCLPKNKSGEIFPHLKDDFRYLVSPNTKYYDAAYDHINDRSRRVGRLLSVLEESLEIEVKSNLDRYYENWRYIRNLKKYGRRMRRK